MRSLLATFCLFLFPALITLNSQGSRINVVITAASDGSAKPTISGYTNLPDGTALMVGVDHAGPGFYPPIAVTVKDHKFKVGPIMDDGYDLPAGNYQIVVTMPYASVQSQNVQSIIGDKAQELTGPLVKYDPKEAGLFGASVEYRSSLVIH